MIVRSQFEVDGPKEAVHLTYLDKIREHAEKYPDRIAYAQSDEISNCVTYAETYRFIQTFGSFLHKRGYKKGDVIAIFLPNRWEFPIAWIGSWLAGLTTTTPRIAFTKHELIYHLNDCNVKALLTDDNLWKLASNALPSVPSIQDIITMNVSGSSKNEFDFHSIIREDDFSLDPRSIPFDLTEDIVHIQYSSGTTGLPKGVLHPHETYEFSHKIFTFYRRVIQNEPDEHLHILFSLMMTGPWQQQLAISEILHGNTVIIQDTPGIEETFKNIERYKIYRIHIVPSNLKSMLDGIARCNYDLSSLKYIECGGGMLSPHLVVEGKEKLGKDIITAYGSTESGTFVTYFVPGNPPDSIGRLAPGYKLKIKTADGQLGGPGEVGEMWIHSRGLLKGYLNHPETTKEVFDGDGFFNTGDVGYFDTDGIVYMCGRSREMIVGSASVKIAPAEIECVLLEIDGVEDCAVVGVPHEEHEAVPRAFICTSKEIPIEEINNHVAERLAHYKSLSGGVEFVERIPRNSAGKTMRSRIINDYITRITNEEDKKDKNDQQ